jgi:hypothetical protein
VQNCSFLPLHVHAIPSHQRSLPTLRTRGQSKTWTAGLHVAQTVPPQAALNGRLVQEITPATGITPRSPLKPTRTFRAMTICCFQDEGTWLKRLSISGCQTSFIDWADLVSGKAGKCHFQSELGICGALVCVSRQERSSSIPQRL